MWRILFIVLILFGFAVLFSAPYDQILAKEPPVETVAASEAFITENFNQTGTLVFYPNNVGPVPYIFFTDQKGNTVAKALVFDELPPTDFSSWSGSRVSITGTEVMEHVVVSKISYVSAP